MSYEAEKISRGLANGLSRNLWRVRRDTVSRQYIPREPLFFAPLWHPDLDASPFLTKDLNAYSCTPSGAYWTAQGYYFDATDDYITWSDTATMAWMSGKGNPTGFKWTVMAWVYNLVPGTSGVGLFSTSSFASADIGVALRVNINRKYYIWISNGSAAVLNKETTALYPNDALAHLVAITYDQSLANTNANVYLDGVWQESASKTTAVPANANTTYAAIFGRVNNSPVNYNCKIRDHLIYNRVLIPTEIRNYYLATKGLRA